MKTKFSLKNEDKQINWLSVNSKNKLINNIKTFRLLFLVVFLLIIAAGAALAGWLVPDPKWDRAIFALAIGIVGTISLIALRNRLRIMRQLEVNEELTQTIFNEAADAVLLIHNQSGRVIECNPKAVALFRGKDKSDILGTLLTNLPGIDSGMNFAAIRDQIRRLGHWQKEMQLNARRNEDFWGDVLVKRVEISNQSCYLVRISDITEKKRAQSKLAWLASFPQNDPIPIIELTMDGEITYCNPAAQREFPDLEQEGLSHPIVDGIQSFAGSFQERKGDGLSREVPCGRTFYHQSVSLVALKRLIRIYNIDIGERKRAEEAIAHSERKNRALVNAIPDSMFRINREGIFLDHKPPTNRDTALFSEEVIAKSIFEVLPNHVGLQVKSHLDEALSTGKIQTFEYQISEDGRSVDHEARIVLSGPDEVLIIVRDITKGKTLSRSLETARETALEASRLKSEFVANMSHEIRTPLHGIMGFAELILEAPIEKAHKDHAEVIRSSSGKLLTLINDVLDFAKIESGNLQLQESAFDLIDCIKDSVKSLAVRAERRGLYLSYDIDHQIPTALLGDVGRLRQVVVNLIGNAVKFTETGGVKLTAQMAAKTHDWVELHFCVQDTGIGIPQDQLEMIFYAFAQGDGSSTRKYGGTGLGLSITKHLIDLMGGTIWVESHLGKGSAFHFELKFDRQKYVARPRHKPGIKILRHMSVLVIQENAQSQEALAALFKKWRMRAIVVTQADDAMKHLADAQSAEDGFSFIVVDTDSEAFDDSGLLAEILATAKKQGSKVIVLTANGQRGDAARYRNLGAAAYLTKPMKESVLLEAFLATFADLDYEDEQQRIITRHSLRAEKRRKKILIAEDNPESLRLLVDTLAGRGHAIKTVKNGKLAIEQLKLESFDLIMLDVQMPVMGGIEAAAKFREMEAGTGRNTPIVAMSAYATEDDREQCYRVGMNAFITKPAKKGVLFELFDKLLSADSREAASKALNLTDESDEKRNAEAPEFTETEDRD